MNDRKGVANRRVTVMTGTARSGPTSAVRKGRKSIPPPKPATAETMAPMKESARRTITVGHGATAPIRGRASCAMRDLASQTKK